MKNSMPTYEQLLAFYHEAIGLTLNHEAINDNACVTAKSMGDALAKVDKNWWATNVKLQKKASKQQHEPVGEITREGILEVKFYKNCNYGMNLATGSKLYAKPER